MTDNNEKHVNAIHMKGNDNAKKDEADKATALVQMRMTPEKNHAMSVRRSVMA